METNCIDTTRQEHDDGVALLIAVVLLLMVSAIGLNALQNAQSEGSAGGRSVRKASTFYAADAVMDAVRLQLDPSGSQYVVPVSQAIDLEDSNGGLIAARTGTADNAAATPPQAVGYGTADGDQLNIGAANSYIRTIYRVDTVAQDPAGGRVELQAQFSVREGAGY